MESTAPKRRPGRGSTNRRWSCRPRNRRRSRRCSPLRAGAIRCGPTRACASARSRSSSSTGCTTSSGPSSWRSPAAGWRTCSGRPSRWRSSGAFRLPLRSIPRKAAEVRGARWTGREYEPTPLLCVQRLPVLRGQLGPLLADQRRQPRLPLAAQVDQRGDDGVAEVGLHAGIHEGDPHPAGADGDLQVAVVALVAFQGTRLAHVPDVRPLVVEVLVQRVLPEVHLEPGALLDLALQIDQRGRVPGERHVIVDDGHVLNLRLGGAARPILAPHAEQVGLDELIEISVEHRIGVPALHAGAHVLHHAVGREHVVADLRPEGDVRLGRFHLVALRLLLAQLQLVDPRAQHLPGHVAVLVLAALVLHRDHDTRGQVGQTNGRVRLVHLLSAGARAAEGVGAHVRRVDHHLDVLVHLGVDEHRGEAGVPARVRVEGRDAHQPVHADFRLEPPVGVVAARDERGVLQARLLARLEVARLDLPAFALRVALIHPVEHLRPVLRFGAPGAGIDLHDGVEVVLGAAQHARQLEPLDALPRLARGDPRFRPRLLVVRFLGQLMERERVLQPLLLALERGDRQLELALLPGEVLGALLVLPEAGLHALALDQLDARALPLDVKATPAAPQGAAKARPVQEKGRPSLRRVADWRAQRNCQSPTIPWRPSKRRSAAAMRRASCAVWWSCPRQWRSPCASSRRSSAARLQPPSRACRRAVSSEMTTSPIEAPCCGKESTSVGRSFPRQSRFSARMRRSETRVSETSRERRSAASCSFAAARRTLAACPPPLTSTDSRTLAAGRRRRRLAPFSAATIRPIDGCFRSRPGNASHTARAMKSAAPPDLAATGCQIAGSEPASRPSVPFRSCRIVVRSGPNRRPPAPMRRWPYILVVDDDADFREGLRAALEMKGYQVEEAGNGKDALERIEKKPPLLVLLDLQMPVMNGRELLQKLRAAPETKDVPVVIISGFGFEWEAELMGAQGYVGKPFEPEELERTIAALLRPRLVSVRAGPAPEKQR